MLNNKGMSLVEIVVGFVLIAILFGSFIKIIDLSSEMTQTSVDTRKNNNELKSRYYDGYNYNQNGKQVFSVDTGAQVSIQEWHKDGDYFTEWKKKASGEFEESTPTGIVIQLNNTLLHVITNKINPNSNSSDFFARYVYTK